MWHVRKKFGAVSEKVGNCALEAPKSSVHPIEIGFAETSCNWSKIPPKALKPPEINLIPLYKIPRDDIGMILTIPPGRGIAWPIGLPTGMVRRAFPPRKIPGSFWPADPSNSKLKPFMYVEDEKKVLTSLRESWQLTLEAPKSSVHPAETGWSAFLLIEAHFGGLLMFDTLFQLSVIPVRSPGCLFC